MSRAALILCLALALAAGEAVQYAAAPGKVITPEKAIAPAFILAETLDGVEFSLTAENAVQNKTQLGRAKYIRVEYEPIKDDINWLKGLNGVEKNDLAGAAAAFQEAAQKSRYMWVRETAWLRAAECLMQLKKPADADAAIAKLLGAFPKTIHQAKAAAIRAQALDAAGKGPEALKAYAELTGKAGAWGIEAAALGARGQAAILARDKKHAEAATAVQGVYGKLDPEREPELFVELGVLLAEQQQLAGDRDPAIATLRRLAYGATTGGARARAHLAWGKALLAVGDAPSLFLAYDHAILASNLRGADGAVSSEALTLARQLIGRIDKLPPDQASDAVKAEYRRYR